MQCELKKVAFCNIFTLAKYICVRFCQCVANLYPQTRIHFRLFILMFSKMALIVLGVSFLPL